MTPDLSHICLRRQAFQMWTQPSVSHITSSSVYLSLEGGTQRWESKEINIIKSKKLKMKLSFSAIN